MVRRLLLCTRATGSARRARLSLRRRGVKEEGSKEGEGEQGERGVAKAKKAKTTENNPNLQLI